MSADPEEPRVSDSSFFCVDELCQETGPRHLHKPFGKAPRLQLPTHDLYNLDVACRLIQQGFGHPYLVGSAGNGTDTPRDVDVRLILDDAEFDALFPNRSRWELLSLAIGDYLRQRTGLPVDFQIQRQTEANELHGKPRNPLGMRRNFAGLGDATPWTVRQT